MTLHYQGNPFWRGPKNEARYGNIPLRQTHAQKETESSSCGRFRLAVFFYPGKK